MDKCTCGHGLAPLSSNDPPPCQHCRTAPLLILGEAWGYREEQEGLPFQGASGKELRDQLTSVGISHVFFTNTINKRPLNNNLETFLVPRRDVRAYGSPVRAARCFEKALIEPELKRLHYLVEKVKPKMVVALGNTALWAVTNSPPKITKSRGTVFQSPVFDVPCVATYHPAAVLRQYKWRVIVQADLKKALHHHKERKERTFVISPSIEEARSYLETHLRPCSMIAFDIETRGNAFISCIGFAPDDTSALVIPFIHQETHYWKTLAEEQEAWSLVREILSLPQPKLAQNGLYDIQYLYHHAVPVRNFLHDTMILHHALQPEMEKGLGFLASVYCDEPAWKTMNDKTGK